MKKKLMTLALTICIIAALITSPAINVKADDLSKPKFTITNWKTTPNPAMRGEDITVSGTINPEPFEVDIPEKDIVLVLDLSGSMNETISGTNTTKISALEVAAKKFIETMQSEKNLKISIVGYSSLATINPNGYNGIKSTRSLDSSYYHDVYNYKSLEESFFDINDDKDTLNSMINNLVALGGTNTGEGLRKAAYMLSKMPASNNKSIILMSDGLPTFATGEYKDVAGHYEFIEGHYEWQKVWVGGRHNGHYENKQVWVDGYYKWIQGTTEWYDYLDINGKDHSYGGSGSDDSDERCSSYAKQIGSILKTYVNNVFSIGYGLGNDKSEGNVTLSSIHESMGGLPSNYYKTSDNIDGIFSTIATEIKNKYAMNNIKMSMNLSSNFTLNIGGNTVSMPTVDYRLVSENNGKARYEAQPVDFKFVVKGNKNGNDLDIFEDAELKFEWSDKPESIKVSESPKANIINNLNPNIEATLKSSDKYESKVNDEQTITYEIKPNDFKSTANDYEGKKEVVFLLDTSSNMQNITQWKNGVINDMVNALVNSDASKTKAVFNFVTYDSSINTNIVNTEEKDQNNVPIDYRNKIQNIVNSIQASENNERKLGEALNKAKDLLDGGDKDATKNIVIIGCGDPTDTMPQNYSNNGYNVITLSINKTQNVGNEFNELKNWHTSIGGRDDNFYYCTASNYNDIANTIVKEMAKKLEGYNKTVQRFTDVSINLDLGSNLEYVDNSTNRLEAIKEGEKLTIKLPAINYYLSGNADSDGRYTYKADSFECSFKVKVKDFTDNKAEFLESNNTDYNNIAYTKLSGEYEKEAIKTPIFINSLNIIHGVYEGKGKIDTSNSLSYVKGTIVPMAASFTYTGSIEPHISVENGIITGTPVIYKLNKNSELEKVAVFANTDSTIVTTGFTEEDTVYILYDIKLSNKSDVNKCTSTITVNDNKFPAYININDGSIPDLY